MPRRITPDSSLETLRQEAKDWLKRLRAGDDASIERYRRALGEVSQQPTLRDVQHAVARELGFPGWSAMKERKRAPADQTIDATTAARYEQMVTNLLDAYHTGSPEAMERHWNDTWHRRSWDAMRRYVQLDLGKPAQSFEGSGPETNRGPDITRDEARWLVARANGQASWDALLAEASKLARTQGAVAPKGVGLVSRGAAGTRTRVRTWDAVFDALEDEEATGIDANGQMTDDLLDRISRYPHVTTLRLGGSNELTDAGLQLLARLANLRHLELTGCERLTDEGFKVLAQLPSLERLRLDMTHITDAGVAHLAACGRLEQVSLAWTRTGDGALRALRGKPRLAHVHTGSLVTDAGIAALHEFPVFARWQGGTERLELTSPDAEPNMLSLCGPITDAWLARLAGLDGLFGLSIDDASLRITPRGLSALAELPHLAKLSVDAVDESMPWIAALPALRFLACQDTIAGDEGFAALSRSKTLEAIWGRRCHNLRGRGFEALARLPMLRNLSVSCLNVPDESLAALPSFPSLRELMPIDVPDAGYRHIAACGGIERLVLMYCRETTDAATEHVATMRNLRRYFASYTRITDRTPVLLATMPALEEVELSSCPGVTNAGIAAFRTAPALKRLSLGGMQHVTPDSIVGLPPRIHATYTL